MARHETGGDPYLDPDTGILRNKLGMNTQAELTQVETAAATSASRQWQIAPGAATYDMQHLQSIHRHLFGEVYDWAGEIRSTQLAKGGTMFAVAAYIPSEGKRVFDELAKERAELGKASPEEFAKRAAYYMGEINSLHPFREGNGRTQREFIGQLANEYGHHFRWSGISAQEMVGASIAIHNGDPRPLEKLLHENMTEYGKEGMTMSNDKATQVGIDQDQLHDAGSIQSQSAEGFQASAGKISDSLARAIEADRERLDLMERSYAKDHPKQEAIAKAREHLERIELATATGEKIALDEIQPNKDLHPVAQLEQKQEPLRLIERTLRATDEMGENGMGIAHSLRKEWEYDAMESAYEDHRAGSSFGDLER